MSELSDEEKKAIENLKEVVDLYNDECLITTDYDFKSIEILLNLIEKQSKEIEELKKPKYIMNFETNEITKLTNEFISKDKIKEILGLENEDDSEEKILILLKTIVDENARLEDIEDRKVQIEYNNVFNKGVKSVEEKIKTILKKYGKKEIEYAPDFYKEIQSLLEEE